MMISPFILGSGKAAIGILESLKILELNHPEWTFNAVQKIPRNETFPDVKNIIFPILIIANPHALHSQAIIDGEKAGFKLIICEKPSATSMDQVHALKKIKVPVAICHVYRQMWGLQTLKEMISRGEFGKIISIEGRYWQSSSAQMALKAQKALSWKNDSNLSGPSDVLIDIATHWADAAIYLVGADPENVLIWRSFVNAQAPHRDTHLHLTMDFSRGIRALGSISKTVHGASNQFEINVIGEKKYGSWKFQHPDVIEVSEGATRTIISRTRSDIGSGHWPHHGLGWLEGYVEILYQAIKKGSYPTLQQNLVMMESLLSNLGSSHYLK
jgi:predicted dehydrogenase